MHVTVESTLVWLFVYKLHRLSQKSAPTLASCSSNKHTLILIVFGKQHVSGHFQQKAQLSQRDRATLRVIDYFAKSLKVTQDHLK